MRGFFFCAGDGLDKAVRRRYAGKRYPNAAASAQVRARVCDRVTACARACVSVRVRLSLLVQGAVGGGVELCSFPAQAVPAMGLTLGMMIGPVALPAIYNAFADRC